jgi:hypothetical protein
LLVIGFLDNKRYKKKTLKSWAPVARSCLVVQSQPQQIVGETLPQKKKKRKKITKKGRVVWLKVEALSSNPVLKKKNY